MEGGSGKDIEVDKDKDRGTDTYMDMDRVVDDKMRTDRLEGTVKSPVTIQLFVGNAGSDKISVKSKQVKPRVGEKAHCAFCGSQGVIVEKYSKRE